MAAVPGCLQQQRIISGTRLPPPHGGHRVVPLGCEFPSPLDPVWPPHGAWHGIGPGFPAAEHDSTRMPRESRAAASSCVIWSRGTIFDIAAVDHCFPVWAVKHGGKWKKRLHATGSRPRPISCDGAPQRSRILMSFPGEATAARVQHAAFCASVCTASRLEEAQRGDGMDGREWRGGEGRAGTAGGIKII